MRKHLALILLLLAAPVFAGPPNGDFAQIDATGGGQSIGDQKVVVLVDGSVTGESVQIRTIEVDVDGDGVGEWDHVVISDIDIDGDDGYYTFELKRTVQEKQQGQWVDVEVIEDWHQVLTITPMSDSSYDGDFCNGFRTSCGGIFGEPGPNGECTGITCAKCIECPAYGNMSEGYLYTQFGSCVHPFGGFGPLDYCECNVNSAPQCLGTGGDEYNIALREDCQRDYMPPPVGGYPDTRCAAVFYAKKTDDPFQ